MKSQLPSPDPDRDASRPAAGGRFSPADEGFMKRALSLARRAAGKTYPNPAVGAVIVRDGAIIGEGFHHRAGGDHAEREALADCRARGRSPAGSTMYVTLEPCNHQGRTPPCVDAVLEAGIRRVVVAAMDPNRSVRGGGCARLAAAGVTVETGLLEAQARSLNEAFHVYHGTGRPWITLKWAISLDGCTSAQTGAAFWISGEASRRDAHRLRAHHACVAVGIGTVLADDPQLNVRDIRWNGPAPLRLVVDSRLRIPETARILGDDPERLLVATCVPAGSAKALRLKARGVRVLHIPAESKPARVDVTEMIRHLSEMGVQSLLVEGGRRLAGSFFAGRLVDRVVAYVAPKFLGSGESALGSLLGGGVERPADAPTLRNVSIRRLGADLRIEGRPEWPLQTTGMERR